MQTKQDSSLRDILASWAGAAFWAVAFALSFCAFFYAAQMLFIPDYSLEINFLCANAAFLGGAVLALMMLPGPAWGWGLLAYILMMPPTLIVSSYIALYNIPFNFSMLYFVWQTFGSQAAEFTESSIGRFPLLPLWALLCIVVPALLLFPLIRSARRAKRLGFILRLGMFFTGLIVFFWGGYIGEARKYNYVAQTYNNFIEFYSDLNFVRIKSRQAPELLANVDIRPAFPADEGETCVLVVGESASRHHWGLYGYPRDTTPFMSAHVASGDLFAFRNVNTTTIASTISQFRALTFLDQTSRAGINDYTFSLVDVFNRAGFTTWWLGNNVTLGAYNLVLESFTRNSAHWRLTSAADVAARLAQRKEEERENGAGGQSSDEAILRRGLDERSWVLMREDQPYDEHLLPWLDEALADPAPKKLIVLHLKGSHGVYAYRYPAAFDFFRDDKGIRSPYFWETGDQDMARIINTYDNSILYTDWVLEEVVRRLEERGGHSWMLYFSDHGEELFNYYAFFPRIAGYLTKYTLDVPFIVWASPEYRRQRDVSAFAGYLDRPMRLDDAIHAIMDLAGLKTDLLDPTRSVLSDQYVMRPRIVDGQFYLDYPPTDVANPATMEQERILNQKFLSEDMDAVTP